MKKVIAFIVAISLILAIPTCIAESSEMTGVFVPDYNSFMNRLCEGMSNYSKYVKKIQKELYDDGNWNDDVYSIYLEGSYDYTIHFDLKSGYLDDFELQIHREVYDEYKESFNVIIDTAILAICPHLEYDDIEGIREELYFDYVINSPVEILSQYYNCGVYRFNIYKSSSAYTFSMYFSINESN